MNINLVVPAPALSMVERVSMENVVVQMGGNSDPSLHGHPRGCWWVGADILRIPDLDFAMSDGTV